MSEFGDKEAVDLLGKQTALINALWTTYVVATFAAGSFTALNGKDTPLGLRIVVGAALTIAFGTFTIGNWQMIRAELIVRLAVARDLENRLKADQSPSPFRGSLETILTTASSVGSGLLVHRLIDACVLLAIWARVFQEQIERLLRL